MATAVTASGGWSTPWRRYPHASTRASISSRARVSRVDHGQPDPKGEALASWLRTHEGFDELGVRVRFVGEARGFAGVAVDGVKEGDLLVRVPRSAMLTAEDARSCPIVGDVASRVSDTAALALKLLAERDAADGSAWSAWIATLPTWEAVRETHPLAWSRERRERALRGSPTLTRLEAMVASSVEDYESIAAACANAGGTPAPRVEDVTWARAMISSRAFYLDDGDDDVEGEGWWHDDDDTAGDDEWWPDPAESGDGLDDDPTQPNDDEFEAFGGVDAAPFDDGYRRHDPTGAFVALVPWADALNHSPDADERSLLSLTRDGGTGAVVAELRASAAYAPGDEVHDSYGVGLSRADSFLRYGFVDVSELKCEDSVDVSGEIFLRELLGGDEPAEPLFARLDAVGLGPGETCVTVTAHGVGESALAWCEMAASAASGEDFDGDFDGDFEDECVAALSRVCEAMAAGYPEQHAAAVGSERGEERACGEDAAALVLASELRALTGFVEWAKKRKGRKLRRMNE